MYVRLAFSVLAHLESEILLVDEVLAVGDASFQKKCLDKMETVGHQGRTVLFVSHNMPAITRLCPRAVLLDKGQVLADGQSQHIISVYLNSAFGTMAVREWPDLTKAPGNDIARLLAVRVRTEEGHISDAVDIRRPIAIEMEYDVLQSDYVLSPYCFFHNQDGVFAFEAQDLDPAWRRRPRPPGRYVSTARIPGNLLAEGTLFVGVGMATMDPHINHFHKTNVVAFQVVDTLDGDSARGDWGGYWGGVVRPLLDWTTQFTPKEP
jgi:lipopolysaccharide transport system ATP-binding protein